MAKTNQQIIVTEGDFGVEILTQFIDVNKKTVPMEGCFCKIKFAYNGNVISEKTGIVIDEPKGIVSVILDIEETQYSGLWTSYWICYDQFNNVTTTENIYYYVQPAIGSVNNPAFTELLNYYNKDEVNDMFKSILEQLNNYTLSKDDVEKYINIYMQNKVGDDFIRQCILDALDNGSDYVKKKEVEKLNTQLTNVIKTVETKLTNDIETINSKLDTKVNNITPIQFGAKADGVTDDTNSIQDALDYINNNGGGTLFFPKGVYRYSKGLYIGKNTIIKGEGIGNSILKIVDNVNLELAYDGFNPNCSIQFKPNITDSEFCGIYDLEIDGNSSNNRHWLNSTFNPRNLPVGDIGRTGTNGILMQGSNVTIPKQVTIKDCYIHDTWRSGIAGNSANNVIIDNCIFKNHDTDHAIYLLPLNDKSKIILNNIIMKGYVRGEYLACRNAIVNNLTVEEIEENPLFADYNFFVESIVTTRGSSKANINDKKITNILNNINIKWSIINSANKKPNLRGIFSCSAPTVATNIVVFCEDETAPFSFVTGSKNPDGICPEVTLENIKLENLPTSSIIVLSRYDCEPIKINGCKITYYNNVVDNSNILVKLQGSFVNNKVIELSNIICESGLRYLVSTDTTDMALLTFLTIRDSKLIIPDNSTLMSGKSDLTDITGTTPRNFLFKNVEIGNQPNTLFYSIVKFDNVTSNGVDIMERNSVSTKGYFYKDMKFINNDYTNNRFTGWVCTLSGSGSTATWEKYGSFID